MLRPTFTDAQIHAAAVEAVRDLLGQLATPGEDLRALFEREGWPAVLLVAVHVGWELNATLNDPTRN